MRSSTKVTNWKRDSASKRRGGQLRPSSTDGSAQFVHSRATSRSNPTQNNLVMPSAAEVGLGTGLVAHLGRNVQSALKLACSAAPQIVSAGAPVTISALPSGLDRKKPATYRWASPPATFRIRAHNGRRHGQSSRGQVRGHRAGQPRAQGRQSAHCATSFVVQEVTAQPQSPTAPFLDPRVKQLPASPRLMIRKLPERA